MRYPERRCNGGPNGPWCGAEADYVATAPDGRLQWFCCDGHRESGEPIRLEPIEEWYERNGMPMVTRADFEKADREAVELLELLEGEPI